MRLILHSFTMHPSTASTVEGLTSGWMAYTSVLDSCNGFQLCENRSELLPTETCLGTKGVDFACDIHKACRNQPVIEKRVIELPHNYSSFPHTIIYFLCRKSTPLRRNGNGIVTHPWAFSDTAGVMMLSGRNPMQTGLICTLFDFLCSKKTHIRIILRGIV